MGSLQGWRHQSVAKGTPRVGIHQLPLFRGHQAPCLCVSVCLCVCWVGRGLGQAVAAPLTETTLSPCPLLSILRLPGAGQGRRLQLAPGSHWRSS